METRFADFKEKFFALSDSATSIVITSHISPDDDSIASVLSVYDILTERYPEKDIKILYSGIQTTRHEMFKNFDRIQFVPDIAEHVDETVLLIMLDGSQYARFSKMPQKLQVVPTTICIDHHASTSDTFTLSLILPEYSSNAELIYSALAKDTELSKERAELFLLGILGDTGNMAHLRPNQTNTFSIVKLLVEKVGVAIDEFLSRYSTISERVFLVIQELVKNTKNVNQTNWPSFQYAYIDPAFVSVHSFTDEEVSAGSHVYMSMYLRRTQGYTWGFVLTPRSDGMVRISSRSLPKSVNVRDFFERLGIGGGHDRASGGVFKNGESVQESITKILEWMKNNTPVLG